MAEPIQTYADPIVGRDGRRYRVTAYGSPDAAGTWHGWLVFEPEEGGGPSLRTDRETTQPKREHLEYWASGLEAIYLEGALARAHPVSAQPRTAQAPPWRPDTTPPAGSRKAAGAAHPPARPLLDPYAVYVQGEEILRQELCAFDIGHLRNIVRAYGLAEEEEMQKDDRAEVAEMIIAAVRERLREDRGATP